MVNKKTKEDELVSKLQKRFKNKSTKSKIEVEREESVFWYDPKMIPLSRPVNHKKK